MHQEAINEKTRRVFQTLVENDALNDFYLAGGTALALALGHRESIDLDWFSAKDFSVADLKNKISKLGNFILTSEEEGTLNAILDEVKISFFHYNYELLFPVINFEKIYLADERDIAAMKIDAISSRGSKKDFIDLYFLLEKYSLENLLELFDQKYSGINYNKLHLLKSLVFFEDAEEEPMPMMLKDVSWEDVKKKIIEEVKKIT